MAEDKSATPDQVRAAKKRAVAADAADKARREWADGPVVDVDRDTAPKGRRSSQKSEA